MATYSADGTTTTNMNAAVKDVVIQPISPDSSSGTGALCWDFPDANDDLGYAQSIPELKSALHVLSQRVCGLGYTADDEETLKRIFGWGNDTFISIMKSLLIEKKIFGDSFAQQIRNEKGTLINIKKLYPGDMRVYSTDNGLIDYYEQRTNAREGKWKRFEPWEILHLSNDRMANEIHGTSIIKSLKKIIDAKNEALDDERKIRHRELALGVLEIDTADPAEQNKVKTQYQNAVNKGEVLVLPKGLAELKDNPNAPRDRIQWLQYLDNLFYQVVGTPKVLVTSEGFTEAGGKAGLLAFEPTEIAEKLELENALRNQLGIKVKFTRAPSILGNEQSNEAANTGQTSIQNNERQVSLNRTE